MTSKNALCVHVYDEGFFWIFEIMVNHLLELEVPAGSELASSEAGNCVSKLLYLA